MAAFADCGFARSRRYFTAQLTIKAQQGVEDATRKRPAGAAELAKFGVP